MRISDWSSDVCSSDLVDVQVRQDQLFLDELPDDAGHLVAVELDNRILDLDLVHSDPLHERVRNCKKGGRTLAKPDRPEKALRSEEHTSELQSLMRISYAVFCLKINKKYEQLTSTT